MISTLLAQIKNPIAPGLSPANTSKGVGIFDNLIKTIVGVLFAGGLIYFFFNLLLGGIKWITSSGDKNQVEAARNQITHSFIGLVILISIFAIIRLIQSLFGVCILNIDFQVLQVGSTKLPLSCGIQPPSGPVANPLPGDTNFPF